MQRIDSVECAKRNNEREMVHMAHPAMFPRRDFWPRTDYFSIPVWCSTQSPNP